MIQVRGSVRRTRGIVAVLACALLLASCSGSDDSGGSGSSGKGGKGGDKPKIEPASVSVLPADKSANLAPNTPVVVKASKGTLTKVTVTDGKGGQLEGALDDAKMTWTSTGTLRFGSTYSVAATATNAAGEGTDSNASFSTMAPKALAYDAMAPLAGMTVGVGYPIRIYFKHDANDKPLSVANKDEVLKHLKVTTTPAQEGAWRWFGGDTEVHWRPKEYWQAGTKVNVNIDLTGVDLGEGVVAKRSREVAFRIGEKHVSIADQRTHRLKVYKGDKLVQDFPAALGKEEPGRYTKSGPHVVVTKDRKKHMDSTTYGLALDAGGYTTDVEWATRISNNGEFAHSAPWSVKDQGVRNVSHGCINLSPQNAKWFFEFSQVGDVVDVKGGPVPLTEKDGDIFDWTIPWSTWVQPS